MNKLNHTATIVVANVLLCLPLFLLSLSGCAAGQAQPAANPTAVVASVPTTGTREITDQAGRKVTVPRQVTKVFSTSPVGTIMVYTINPDKLLGWNYDLNPTERKYILPKYLSLPNLGGWYGKSTGNSEEIIRLHPDVIVSVGDIDPTSVSQSDQIQHQLNIPVVMIDSALTRTDQAYDLLGDLIGETVQAGALAAYCRDTITNVTEKAKLVPQDKRVRVYYAEGPKGLQTDPSGSNHTETLDLVGAINVANIENKGGSGMSPVSLEQVISWNPDVILSWDDERGGYYSGILSDPDWSSIKAVRDKRVYRTPNTPFNWFDRPFSSNRILGVKWVANLLYPDIYKYDIRGEAKKFYSLFYHTDLTDQQVTELLK